MFNLEKILSKIVQYGLYAILLTPLVFWPRALYAFATPKFMLFQVLVEIVFVSWILLIIYRGEAKQVILNLRKNYLVISFLGLFIIYFISAIFGVDFSRSLWGIGARMTGLFTELHFFAWFLLLISYFKNDKEKWSRYMNVSFVVAVLIALSAFYQHTDWRLVYGYTFFNNPTFAGPYFIFHFFWGLYQVLKSNFRSPTSRFPEVGLQASKLDFKRWAFILGTLLLAFVIFIGEIRGAILGLLVGILLCGIGLIFSRAINRRFKISIVAFFTVIFLGLVGLWLIRESNFVYTISPLKRLTQLSLGDTTVNTRFLVWKISLIGIKENPLLGVGPENFNYVFNAHYNPSLLKYGLGETWFDKPHNEFLEVASETGLLSAMFYMFISASAILYLFRLFKSGEKILAIAVGSAFISYLTAVFFSFDSFGSWFGLFLMLGFLASYTINNTIGTYPDNSKRRFKAVFGVLGLILVAGLLYINYGIWQANIADADALRLFSSNPAQGIELFKKSLSYTTPYKSEYRFDLFASVAGAISKNLPVPNLEQNINVILEESEKAISAHPNNAAYYTDLLKLYNILAEKGRDPHIISWAEMYGKKSLELSPNRQETLYYLARTALLKGDTELAVSLTKHAVDVEPSINVSHWYFGLALIANNRGSEGIVEIKKALALGYKPQNAAEEAFIKHIGL